MGLWDEIRRREELELEQWRIESGDDQQFVIEPRAPGPFEKDAWAREVAKADRQWAADQKQEWMRRDDGPDVKWTQTGRRKIIKRHDYASYLASTPSEVTSSLVWNTFLRVIRGERYDGPFVIEFDPTRPGSEFLDPFSAERLGLFPWRLAAAELIIKLDIGKVSSELRRLVVRLEALPSWQSATASEYSFHSIQKRTGGLRRLQVPAGWLKGLQRQLYRAISPLVAHHPMSHGFTQGRSIVTNAELHAGQPVVMRLDIKDAFASTTKAVVLAALKSDLASLNLSKLALAILAEIFTFQDALPTGAPSSPFLLNRVLYAADLAISKLAEKQKVQYSRYADDLTFSGGRATSVTRSVRHILGKIGYRLNDRKTRVYRSGRRQIVTGLVVNTLPNLPRETRRNLRAVAHSWATTGRARWKGEEISESQVLGHVSYYAMTNADAANVLRKTLSKK
jgi:retron-type reverse transcriptase